MKREASAERRCSERRFAAMLAAAWLVFAAYVYIPDIGRGFVKDDFHWIEAGQQTLTHPADGLMPSHSDFFRPLIAATFAADFAAHGLNPQWYGYENFLLYMACALALWRLGRAAGLTANGAALASFVWAVNPHGINMAVIWISGRTALCLTLFALIAGTATLRRQYLVASAALACALAAKEEAVLLPFVLTAWVVLLMRGSEVLSIPEGHGLHGRERWRMAAALFGPLVVYCIVRMQSAAIGPRTAPAYYQFTFAPAAVLRNALEYLDRGVTASLAVAALALLLWGARPALDASRRRLLAAAACWFAAGYALTVFLPVRSSLYAVFPSVGAAIACAAVAEAAAGASTRRAWMPLGAAAGALVVALSPIYSARNDRWVEPARLSQRTLTIVAGRLRDRAVDGTVVLADGPSVEPTFTQAFGVFARDAIRLETGRPFDAWIDPPPPDWQLAGIRPPGAVQARFELHHGAVVEAIR
ncbi:MAG TPA: hypothetical protein VEU08_22990 [Vicinamibacterales bacterium]|nr:hypothetical protein [Vicinamibacterales bacterium]